MDLDPGARNFAQEEEDRTTNAFDYTVANWPQSAKGEATRRVAIDSDPHQSTCTSRETIPPLSLAYKIYPGITQNHLIN